MQRETVKVVVTIYTLQITECIKNGHKTNTLHVTLLLFTNLVVFFVIFTGKIEKFYTTFVQTKSKAN